VYASSADLPLCGEGVSIGVATNNIAEYRGCIAALERLLSWKVRRAVLRLDSQLVVRQLNCEYRVKHENLKPLLEKAEALRRQFEELHVEHVPREANRLADRLANDALDRSN
jgi:probable phosphoglycerate mutase